MARDVHSPPHLHCTPVVLDFVFTSNQTLPQRRVATFDGRTVLKRVDRFEFSSRNDCWLLSRPFLRGIAMHVVIIHGKVFMANQHRILNVSKN